MNFRIKMQNKLHIIGIFLLVLFAGIDVQGGFVKIGENCSVNPFCVLYGHGGLEIGDGVRIAAKTTIIPANHRFDRIDIPQYKQSLTKKGIKIEDDVWIGTNVTILDGVTIHRGSVVGGYSCNKRYSSIFCCCRCTGKSY